MRTVKKHDERRKEILKTAEKLFSKKGFAKATIADIINTIGIAKGTFYHYYKSKEELLNEFIYIEMEKTKERLESIVNDNSMSPYEKLAQIFRKSMHHKTINKSRVKMLAKALYNNDNNIVLLHKRSQKYLEIATPLIGQILKEGVASKTFKLAYPIQTVDLILRMSHSIDENFAKMLTQSITEESISDFLKICENFSIAVHRLLGIKENQIELIYKNEVLELLN